MLVYNESCTPFTHLHKNENPFRNTNFNFCELIQFFELGSLKCKNFSRHVYIYIYK